MDHSSETMDIFLTRQPVFDINKRLYAYELLFCQPGKGKFSVCSDGNRVTAGILSSTFLNEGVEKITGGKICFIPFTRELVLQGVATFFPPSQMVVGIPCMQPPDSLLVTACEELKSEGYVVCLDQFVLHDNISPLLRLADHVRIDFSQYSREEIEEILQHLSGCDLKLLADHLETYELFHAAGQLNFDYFQGNFFCRPEVLRVKGLASSQHNLTNLLAELNSGETTVDRLERVVSTDVGISYKLLRYINSAHFYLVREVTSVRQAIQYLGVQEIRRFISMIVISQLSSDKPEELVRLSLVRARFCELLADASSSPRDTSSFFLLGLFSLLDALLDTSISSIMRKLPLASELNSALVEGKGPMMPFLRIVQMYEQARFEECGALLAEIGVGEEDVSRLYLDAVQFAAVLAE